MSQQDGHEMHTHAHHTHHRRGAPLLAQRAVRVTLAAVIPATVLTIIGMIMLWPHARKTEPWTGAEHVKGDVTRVQVMPCQPGQVPGEDPGQPDNGQLDNGQPGNGQPGNGYPDLPGPQKCGEVTVTLTDGPDRGKQVVTPIPGGPGALTVEAGDHVILVYGESFAEPGVQSYDIIDHQRSFELWVVMVAFVLTVVAFGRWRGLTALAGLVFTFAVLLMFIVPAILQGSPPLLVAIVGAAAIMLVVLYVTHGVNIPTSMAVLGTLASLSLTGFLAAASTSLLHLTGMSNEESMYVTFLNADINMQGLLLAGILIGALGVLDDVTVTQAYTVVELSAANPAMGFLRLYQAAARVGRAHITSVINTIVLAYAGASLPMLLLLSAGGAPWGEMITSEMLTQEVIRSAVGTIGLIAAVPITTALSALAMQHSTPRVRLPKPPKPPKPERRRLDDLEVAWGIDPVDADQRGTVRRVL